MKWPSRKLTFVTSNRLKKMVFDRLRPPQGCKFFPFEVDVHAYDVDPEIQSDHSVMITKNKVERVRHIIGYDTETDILMEDSQLQITKLGGMPGAMTKYYVRALPAIIAQYSEGLHATHRSTVYWDRAHTHMGTYFHTETEGLLLEPKVPYSPKDGFDPLFHPLGRGWNRPYRAEGRDSLESLLASCNARVNLGCGITRVLMQFFINAIARRATEEHIVGHGQFPSTKEFRNFVNAVTKRELKTWFLSSGLHQGYTLRQEVDECAEALLVSGVGVGEMSVRMSPVILEALRAEGRIKPHSTQ